MIEKCRLCLEEKDLQRKSHIIPEFFYSECKLFHEHHNLYAFDLLQYLKSGRIKPVITKQKSGFYDEYILCSNCDGVIINNYETYTRSFFYSQNLPKGKELIARNAKTYIECLNADYTSLKLLYLSILWRADISNQKLFSEISLPDKVKEDLRQMILHGNPRSDKEYPIFFMHTFFDKTISQDNLIQPIKTTFGNEDGFTFFFGGFIVTYTYGIDGMPENLLKYRLHESGTFRALTVPPGKSWELINEWYNK
jgi:hypothetical protein